MVIVVDPGEVRGGEGERGRGWGKRRSEGTGRRGFLPLFYLLNNGKLGINSGHGLVKIDPGVLHGLSETNYRVGGPSNTLLWLILHTCFPMADFTCFSMSCPGHQTSTHWGIFPTSTMWNLMVLV